MSRRKIPRTAPPGSRRRLWWFAGLAAAIALGLGLWLAARAGRPPTVRAERVEYAPVAGPLTLPVNVMQAAPELRQLYEFAARRPDVLHYLPCFCGCGGVHQSNYACFIDEVRADGKVLIDEMSFT